MSFLQGFLKLSEEQNSSWKAMAAAGAGVGALTYAALRKKKLHGSPGLQAIQKASDRVVKYVQPHDRPGAKATKEGKGILRTVKRWMDPSEYVSDYQKLKDMSNAALLDLREGGSVKQSLNYAPRSELKRITKEIGYDKLKEQEFIRKAIGKEYAIPTRTTEHLKGKTIEDRHKDLNRRYRGKWFVKERGGYGGMETGSLAHAGTDLHGSDYDTMTLRDALSKNKDHKHIVQPLLPIKKEFRLHVLGDTVIPRFTFDRQLGSHDYLWTKDHDKVEKAVQKALKGKKLPKTMFGYDVALLKNGKIKIIETNPVDSQGYSGFLDMWGAPLGRHADMYKSLTGRTAPYRAAAAAGATGTAAAIGAKHIDRLISSANKNPVDGPYSPDEA